jgi:hypothetical protein
MMWMPVFPTWRGAVIIRKAMTTQSARQTIFGRKAPVEIAVATCRKGNCRREGWFGAGGKSNTRLTSCIMGLQRGHVDDWEDTL